ncbi:MAG: hypothetical protein GWN01_03095 [Nitrosopumilaceae archaeon]|nr:hypothetical protein [Nitrosopumilaceae archaeon]NIT99952.1 hypothetical protein [Nitrosopumilaceae archaeon]NIU86306.1 hypothetical protein [Nitrosopumilaceae archaeon]NIV65061.1 hypothetical protein [Nitrosopumilaceae archaeon]NIX60555.1 hypothetical protein [Nitrosopumilaceae archaeon]
MDLNAIFEECKFNVEQMKYYDPDPFYVHRFLIGFLNLVDRIIEEILVEANRDFGLFLKDRITLEKFEERAKQKEETMAINFAKWFKNNYEEEHCLPYPKLINQARKFLKNHDTLPFPTIKLISKSRYDEDPSHPIPVRLKDGKIISKEDLDLSVNRYSKFFLNLINSKRINNGEPTVAKNDVIPAAFLTIDRQEFEIAFSCQLYLSTLRDLISDSKTKIRKSLSRN